MSPSFKKPPEGRTIVYLLLLAIVSGGAIILVLTQRAWWRQLASTSEAARPANLKVTQLSAPKCDLCAAPNAITRALTSPTIAVTETKTVAYDSAEGQALVARYNIRRVPTAIITGELDKKNIADWLTQNTVRQNDAAVWKAVAPPYVELPSGKVRGRVDATIIGDRSCPRCFDSGLMFVALTRLGFATGTIRTLDAASADGRATIATYGVSSTPAIILSPELAVYDAITAAWKNFGSRAADGSFIARPPTPPYRDLSKNKIVGLTTITLVTDKGCTSCYDPEQIKEILEKQYGVALAGKTKLELSTPAAAALIKKYRLLAAPTVILSADAAAYPLLVRVWPQVGTVEADGAYVFRNPAALGPVKYKDLEKNNIVDAKPSE